MNKFAFLMEHIISLTIVLIIASSTSLKANGTVTKDPPKIILILHKPPEVPEKIQLEHEADFVVEEDVDTLGITCEAEYPITFNLPYPQTAEEIKTKAQISHYRISDWDNEAMAPINLKFKWMIEFTLMKSYPHFLSLNITCVPLDRNITQPSVHIYWKGYHSIEHQGKTLHIPARLNNNPPLVLPCRPANPNFKVILEKKTIHKNPDQQVWKKFNSSSSHFAFDPKFGFTFQKNPIDQNIFGLYRCSIEETTTSTGKHNEISFIILNVTKSINDSYYDYSFVPKSIFNGSAGVSYQQYDKWSDEIVKCCSGIQDKPPKFYYVRTVSPLMSQVVRHSILKDIATRKIYPMPDHHSYRLKDCYKTNSGIGDFSLFVVCRGQNIDFAEELTYAFDSRKANNRSNISNISETFKNKCSDNEADKPVGVPNRTIPATQLLPTADLKTATIFQKIMLTVLRQTEYGSRSRRHFCDKQVIPNTNYKYAEAVELSEYDRDFYYEGEQMIFMCLGGKTLYANGAYLRLTLKNGTKALLKPTPEDYTTMPCQGSAKGIGGNVNLRGNARLGYIDRTAEVKFGTAVANQEMASVECFMPQWYGTEWDIISKPLTFVPSKAPRFAEIDNEVINFSEGAKWKLLICTVIQGQPPATVTILNDGLPIKANISRAEIFHGEVLPGNDTILTSYRNKNKHTIVISFPKVKMDHVGVYQCKASNIYTDTTRTMKVSVIGEPSTTNTVI